MNKRIFALVFVVMSILDSAWCQTKLTVCTWNIGKFGEGEMSGYQGDNPQEKVKEWKAWLKSHRVDIIGLNEWWEWFDKGKTINSEEELIAPLYANRYIANPIKSPWITNGLATNYKVKPGSQTWINLVDPYYFALIETLIIDGHEVDVISAHIPWRKQYHAASLDVLHQELKRHKTFIFLGDTNCSHMEQSDFYVKDGYNMANPFKGRWLPTYADGSAIDNVITSPNIKITKVWSSPSGLYKGDHNPFFAKLVIHWDK